LKGLYKRPQFPNSRPGRGDKAGKGETTTLRLSRVALKGFSTNLPSDSPPKVVSLADLSYRYEFLSQMVSL